MNIEVQTDTKDNSSVVRDKEEIVWFENVAGRLVQVDKHEAKALQANKAGVIIDMEVIERQKKAQEKIKSMESKKTNK